MNASSLLTALVSTVVLLAGSVALAAEELRGVYMELHGNPKFGVFPLVADKDWRRLARELKALGVNAIFPEVVDASGAIYPSQVVATRPPENRQGFPDLLQVILDAAHAEGLEVHPWTIEWSHAPKDTPPERLVHDKDGNTEPFLCPSVEANRALMRDMLLELASRYDIDGLQYDYMRLPGDKYCYCDACRAGFEKLIGERVADWPAGVSKGGPLEARYLDYLCDTVSGFVEQMKPILKKAKPNIVISVAVWANNSTSRNVGVRQDWGNWVAGGWLDFVAPMNYGNKWIVDRFPEYAEAEAKNVAGRLPLVYGLGAYLDTPEGEVAAVKAGRALKCSGFIIYTLTQETFTKHLPALSREVWQEPATVPAFGRKGK
jgi:uncharacterized lipoprotein YddW (UPF0748 family)